MFAFDVEQLGQPHRGYNNRRKIMKQKGTSLFDIESNKNLAWFNNENHAYMLIWMILDAVT